MDNIYLDIAVLSLGFGQSTTVYTLETPCVRVNDKNDYLRCGNIKIGDSLSDTFEQQGYQSDTMAWRNSYLQGANELRTNQTMPPIQFNSADIIAASPTDGVFVMMTVRLREDLNPSSDSSYYNLSRKFKLE